MKAKWFHVKLDKGDRTISCSPIEFFFSHLNTYRSLPGHWNTKTSTELQTYQHYTSTTHFVSEFLSLAFKRYIFILGISFSILHSDMNILTPTHWTHAQQLPRRVVYRLTLQSPHHYLFKLTYPICCHVYHIMLNWIND